MNIQEFEDLIISEIKNVVSTIIVNNPTLPIAVKKGERQGDAISKFLEQKFVENTQTHSYLNNSQTSPLGKTKNPYDCQTFFRYKTRDEKIWIDFKAVNIDNKDSNPDSGTPDKIITLIKSGSFYLAYVLVFYKGNDGDDQLSFVKKNDMYVKAYFLKDISPTVRITPANQLQVNYTENPVYRTRKEFINFLIKKKKESFERRLNAAEKALEDLNNGIIYKEITVKQLHLENKKQEEDIRNL